MVLILTFYSNWLGTFFCTETRDNPSDDFQRTSKDRVATVLAKPRVICSSRSLQHTISVADSYVSKHFPHSLISRNAIWRNEATTAGQIEFLNKFKAEWDKYDLPDEC